MLPAGADLPHGEKTSRNSAMRKTEANGKMLQAPWRKLRRIAGFTAVALGVGLLIAAGPARAADDDDDEMTFEEKIIDTSCAASAAPTWKTAASNIASVRRSSLPPKLYLPQPGTVAAESKVPNWPKDPDEARRKAAIAARKKAITRDPAQGRPYADAERAGAKGVANPPAAIRSNGPRRSGDAVAVAAWL
jgi:hypothetical protein